MPQYKTERTESVLSLCCARIPLLTLLTLRTPVSHLLALLSLTALDFYPDPPQRMSQLNSALNASCLRSHYASSSRLRTLILWPSAVSSVAGAQASSLCRVIAEKATCGRGPLCRNATTARGTSHKYNHSSDSSRQSMPCQTMAAVHFVQRVHRHSLLPC